MKIEGVFMEPPESHQACFGVCPEAFNTVDMCVLGGKFIIAALHSEMLLAAQVHKAIVAPPAIRVDHTFKGNLTANNAL